MAISPWTKLYLIEIPHQTTTVYDIGKDLWQLYLIEIPHQTTTLPVFGRSSKCCILSKFHIKPQLNIRSAGNIDVVSYRNSTSNHNNRRTRHEGYFVVSYRNSTSNHNLSPLVRYLPPVVSYRNSTSNHNDINIRSAGNVVVSYRNSTSNHNFFDLLCHSWMLYLIEIPHQTTTWSLKLSARSSCILSKFHIKPQLVLVY